MRFATLAAASVLIGSLNGCATLNESQCAGGDWFGIGESDARAGHLTSRINQHGEACAKYALAPDPNAYDAGYRQGLVVFCTPESAFALGHRGGTYYRQCPPDAERDFLPAFDLGADVYAVDQEVIRIEREIDELRDDIKDDDTSPEARSHLERQLDYVKDERDRRQYERSNLLDRARQRGYGDIW
jgi:hypothetical protein